MADHLGRDGERGAVVTQTLLWTVRDELQEEQKEGHGRLRMTTNQILVKLAILEDRQHASDLMLAKLDAQRQAEKEFYARQTPPPMNRSGHGWPTLLLMTKATFIAALKWIVKGNS